MEGDSLQQDYGMLKSTLLEDELVLDETLPPEALGYWSSVDSTGSIDQVATSSSHPLSFSVNLPRSAKLVVQVTSEGDLYLPPTFSVSCDDRNVQSELTAHLAEVARDLAQDDFPIFSTYTALQGYLLSNIASPPPQPSPSTSHLAQAGGSKSPEAKRPIQTKLALCWAHHLLAQSKRRDIHKFSIELRLWSLTKVGYPGVIVVEGLGEEVDEFLRRIKNMQWYALQVRHEETMDYEDAPSTSSSVTERENQILASKCPLRLAVNYDVDKPDFSKPGGRETDSMSDLAIWMKAAGLGSVFASAMKLPGVQ